MPSPRSRTSWHRSTTERPSAWGSTSTKTARIWIASFTDCRKSGHSKKTRDASCIGCATSGVISRGCGKTRQVLVHGDATPDNFMFGDGLQVIAFDLERAKRADRVFDTGRIAGELKHFFLRATGKKDAAEPFIGHFLWEYACHFPNRDRAFQSITGRTPFYLGMTLLRIARNQWIDPDYRRRLIHEARACLRAL